MLTDHERAALERLRECRQSIETPPACDMDIAIAIVLRDHKPDDDEVVTLEWLIACGGRDEDNPNKITFYREDALPIGVWKVDDGMKVVLRIVDNHSVTIVRGLRTRRDFRDLCRVLRIELKEQK